jgi:lipid II:glycine glycyltransferase (peptidoglycan interpeptide bridge formation enzyme)
LDQLFERLHSRLKAERAVTLDITAPFPFPHNYEIFCRNGYISETEAKGECSVIIDLQSDVDFLWKGVRRFARRNIKRAIEEGVEVKGIKNEMELRDFHRIYRDTCNRRGFQPSPYRMFEAFWKELEPRGKSKFFLAWWKNIPIAGILNTFYGEQSVPYIACSLNRFWNLHPNHLLFWHSIKWSKEVAGSSVFKLYHLPARRERVQGIDYFTFKTCFGGSLIEECSFYRKTFSPVRFKISQMLHGQISKTRRFARLRHLQPRNQNCSEGHGDV